MAEAVCLYHIGIQGGIKRCYAPEGQCPLETQLGCQVPHFTSVKEAVEYRDKDKIKNKESRKAILTEAQKQAVEFLKSGSIDDYKVMYNNAKKIGVAVETLDSAIKDHLNDTNKTDQPFEINGYSVKLGNHSRHIVDSDTFNKNHPQWEKYSREISYDSVRLTGAEGFVASLEMSNEELEELYDSLDGEVEVEELRRQYANLQVEAQLGEGHMVLTKDDLDYGDDIGTDETLGEDIGALYNLRKRKRFDDFKMKYTRTMALVAMGEKDSVKIGEDTFKRIPVTKRIPDTRKMKEDGFYGEVSKQVPYQTLTINRTPDEDTKAKEKPESKPTEKAKPVEKPVGKKPQVKPAPKPVKKTASYARQRSEEETVDLAVNTLREMRNDVDLRMANDVVEYLSEMGNEEVLEYITDEDGRIDRNRYYDLLDEI